MSKADDMRRDLLTQKRVGRSGWKGHRSRFIFTSIKSKIIFFLTVVMLLTASSILYLTQQDMVKEVGDIERNVANNILKLISLNVKAGYDRLLYDKMEILSHIDTNLYDMVQLCLSGINGFYELADNDQMSRKEARRSSLKWLKSLPKSYGRIFIMDRKGLVISSNDQELVGFSFDNVVDIKTRNISKVMRYDSLSSSGDFAVFSWKFADSKEYSMNKGIFIPIPDLQATLGIAFDYTFIEAESSRKLAKIMESLNITISNLRIGESAFIVFFDSNGKILIKPRDEFNFYSETMESKLLERMRDVADEDINHISFKGDSHNLKLDMEAYVTYFKVFDWYAAVVVPLQEIERPAFRLAKRQSLIIAPIFLISIICALVIVGRISNPIKLLTKYVMELRTVDLSRDENETSAINAMPLTFNDEVGRLAEAFVTMRAELRDNIRRTIEATTAKERFEREAAVKANSAKSLFLANMSHELRTPLNHIIGFTEMIVDGHCGEINQMQEELMNDVLGSSRHLLSLINDILDMTKIEAGKQELFISTVRIAELVDSSLNMIQEQIRKNDFTIKTDYTQAPESIEADERKLRQIMYNLVSNAAKFTPDRGTINITVRAEDIFYERSGETLPGIRFVVKDSGIGIVREHLSKVFEPFEQVENVMSREHQGTGLGLSLTRQLVELHGGQITVYSEGADKGSEFIFVIPQNVGTIKQSAQKDMVMEEGIGDGTGQMSS